MILFIQFMIAWGFLSCFMGMVWVLFYAGKKSAFQEKRKRVDTYR